MRLYRTLLSAYWILLTAGSAYAGNFNIEKSQSELAATMHASPSHDFTSVAKDYTCDIEIAPDTLTIKEAVCRFNFADLDSSKNSRDKKMRSWVDVKKHPTAKFVFEKNLPDTKSGEHVAKGTFSMHGMEHPITITYTLKNKDGEVILDGHTEFNHKNWGLDQVRLLFFSVDPVIKPHFHLVGKLDN